MTRLALKLIKSRHQLNFKSVIGDFKLDTVLLPDMWIFFSSNSKQDSWRCLELLSCQPRVTVMSCSVNKVIRAYELINYLSINPIRRICVSTSEVYTLVFYLAIVNEVLCHCHSWLARQ